MELAGYLRILRRRWWIVALAVLVCVGAAFLATARQTEKYRTSTRLLVSGQSGVSAADESTRRLLANQRGVALAQLATTGPAETQALQLAGNLPGGAGISATADGSSPFVTITVVSRRAATAQAVANAYATVLPRVATALEKLKSGDAIQVEVLEAAGLPKHPFKPDLSKNLGVGLLLGLLLGFASAILRETLDPSIRDGEAIRGMVDLPVLGTIPLEFGGDQLLALSRPHSRRAEAYRQVRTSIELTGATAPRSVVVTSPGQGDGKSSLAANLAVAAARTGKRVCVIDGDLRRPAMSRYLAVPEGQPGLTDVLRGVVDLEAAMVDGPAPGLRVLGGGTKVANPSELVGSPAMEELIRECEERFDVTIIDSPPVLAVTDAMLLGVQSSAIVMVVRLGVTTRTGLRRALEALGNVHAPVLGVVGNAAVEVEDKGYGYGYYSSTAVSTGEPAPPLAAPRARHRAVSIVPPPAQDPAPAEPPVMMQAPAPPPTEEPLGGASSLDSLKRRVSGD